MMPWKLGGDNRKNATHLVWLVESCSEFVHQHFQHVMVEVTGRHNVNSRLPVLTMKEYARVVVQIHIHLYTAGG